MKQSRLDEWCRLGERVWLIYRRGRCVADGQVRFVLAKVEGNSLKRKLDKEES